MPLLWASLAILSGIVLASLLTLPAQLWLALGLLGVLAAMIAKRARPRSTLLILLLPGLLFLGAARYQVARPEDAPDLISHYNDTPGKIYVTGTLAEPPD